MLQVIIYQTLPLHIVLLNVLGFWKDHLKIKVLYFLKYVVFNSLMQNSFLWVLNTVFLKQCL